VIVTRYAAALWPDQVERARPHADHAFDDVPAFVDHLLGGTPG
jgi:hypothetical protein